MSDAKVNPCAVKIFGVTSTGAVRSENEDAVTWWIDKAHGISFAALADGMGGHKGGALASGLSTETIQTNIQSALRNVVGEELNSIDQLSQLMVKAAKSANAAVRNAREQYPDLNKMGTTLVLVAAWGHKIAVLHAGDSRCYLHTDGGLEQPVQNEVKRLVQLTRDDSVVQAMLEEGVITLEDIPRIPYRNTLTNALGIQAPLKYTLDIREVTQGDQLLLCSDGFHNVVSLEEVDYLLSTSVPIKKKAQQLVQLSLDQHTDDNTSVILMQFDGDYDTNDSIRHST